MVEHFDSADDSSHVAGIDANSGKGINRSEPTMESLMPALGSEGHKVLAEFVVGGNFGNMPVLEESPDILPRAPDKPGAVPSRPNLVKRGTSVSLISPKAVHLGRVCDIEEMVRDAATIGQGGFRSADVHAPIDLSAVGVDDFAPESVGEFQGHRRFA